MIDIFLKVYSGVWHLALPFLQKKPRLADGWAQRVADELPQGGYDLWIQSASGGESLLTCMLIKHFDQLVAADRKVRIVATSMTRQGVDTLKQAVESLSKDSGVHVDVCFFPFDSPKIMSEVFDKFFPRLIAVMETELWPSFLVEAKRRSVPLLLVNGRMSAKSYKSYSYLRKFFKKYGPEHIWAISKEDRDRFGDVCGQDRSSLMHNIKFDRMVPQATNANVDIKKLFQTDKPIVLFGSIRKEEESLIFEVIQKLTQAKPNIQLAVFPKHIERADNWIELLFNNNFTAVKRSNCSLDAEFQVVVWDTFGELAAGYGVADAVFVGGSLVDLGGQNFLEPLAHGVRPIIGPYWSDFFWVGRDIIEQKLVLEVESVDGLVSTLLAELETPADQESIKNQVETFLQTKKGGTQKVCAEILKRL